MFMNFFTAQKQVKEIRASPYFFDYVKDDGSFLLDLPFFLYSFWTDCLIKMKSYG